MVARYLNRQCIEFGLKDMVADHNVGLKLLVTLLKKTQKDNTSFFSGITQFFGQMTTKQTRDAMIAFYSPALVKLILVNMLTKFRMFLSYFL